VTCRELRTCECARDVQGAGWWQVYLLIAAVAQVHMRMRVRVPGASVPGASVQACQVQACKRARCKRASVPGASVPGASVDKRAGPVQAMMEAWLGTHKH